MRPLILTIYKSALHIPLQNILTLPPIGAGNSYSFAHGFKMVTFDAIHHKRVLILLICQYGTCEMHCYFTNYMWLNVPYQKLGTYPNTPARGAHNLMKECNIAKYS